jgi:hypothetical protein
MMKIFTVIANRWGDDESHSYFVGAYDDVVRAYRAAIAEEYWRGGKYECVVHESELNAENVCKVDGESKEEWCEKQCLPEGHYALDIMTRVNEHYDLYNITEGENPLVKK